MSTVYPERKSFINHDVPSQWKVPSALTPREFEVLTLVVKGMRNKEIAHELCITVSVVETHLHHIFRKLNVSSRTQAAIYALSNDLFEAKNGGNPSSQA